MGPVDKQEQERHQPDRARDDRDLHVGDRRAVGSARHVVGDRLDDLRIRQRIAAPDDHREVLQDDRQADRRDQRR
jgi:hypothetical protein